MYDPYICQKFKIREGCSFKKALKMVDKFNTNIIVSKDEQINDLELKMDTI